MSEKYNFYVDVDNPAFKAEVDPISAHSKIAGVYKFRPPYQKDFFHQASIKLGLSKTDNLLDICCGRGEIAAGFSEYVNHINAVDGSSEMLENAIDCDNVTYYLADVNTEKMPFAGRADCILIGSAVHWIKAKTLSNLVNKNLSQKGSIFVSHTLFKFDNEPYAEVLKSLNIKYGRTDNSVDLWGLDKLSECEFIQTDQIRMVRNVTLDINFLYQNQLSYAYRDFYKIIAAEAKNYKQEFFDLLMPFSLNKRLCATLVNWAVIYSPKILKN